MRFWRSGRRNGVTANCRLKIGHCEERGDAAVLAMGKGRSAEQVRGCFHLC